MPEKMTIEQLFFVMAERMSGRELTEGVTLSIDIEPNGNGYSVHQSIMGLEFTLDDFKASAERLTKEE